MNGSILWYVHDQGLGHLRRLEAVRPFISSPLVVASSLPEIRTRTDDSSATFRSVVSDRLPHPIQGPGPFHYTPISRVLRQRSHELLDLMLRHDCTSAVVDVSAEIATLCRLAGLKVVTVRQSGVRNDRAHRMAHEVADAVWIPQHRDLEPHVEDIERVQFSGAFSTFDARPPDRAGARRRLGWGADRRAVLVVVGSGGSTFPQDRWRTEPSPPEVDITIIGLPHRWSNRSNTVRSVGHVHDPFDLMSAADGAIAAAGWGATHDLASVGTPTALVAEHRPFDEQSVRLDALSANGVVHRLDHWPTPPEVPSILGQLDQLPADPWNGRYDRCGAQRAAHIIEGVHRG